MSDTIHVVLEPDIQHIPVVLPGQKGDPGATGAQGATGATGPAGADGAAGAAGADGEKWHLAASDPAGGTGAVGDLALNTTSSDYFEKTGASTWTLRGNLKGLTGNTGATGADGATGATGAPGAAGAPGSVWHSGSGAPPGGTGVVGDFYLATGGAELGNVYTKTGASTWTLQGNIRGATGATGSQGAAGQGVPTGGTTGQVLKKLSAADFDTAFQNESGGGGSDDAAWSRHFMGGV